jgi:hypothetical protein
VEKVAVKAAFACRDLEVKKVRGIAGLLTEALC